MPASLPKVGPESSIREAMETIDRGTFAVVLVVDSGGRLMGTITDGDIRRALLREAAFSDPVGPIMNRSFLAVGSATPRSDVLDLMRAHTLLQVPIVDRDGKLLGIHLLREIIGATARPNWAMVMAGGRGERLRPLTDTLPKPMVPVAGRPILERIVLHLVGFGIRRVFISVHYMAELIEQHFGNGAAHGCQIEYVREPEPLGTGGALGLLPEVPSSPLLVLNGDLLTQFDVGALLEGHSASGATVTMAVHEHRYTVPFGVVEAEPAGRVRAVREKPTVGWKVNAGIYVLEPELVKRVRAGQQLSMPGLIEECLELGKAVSVYQLEEECINVGNPGELRRARGEQM